MAQNLCSEKYDLHLGLITQSSVQPGNLPPAVTVHCLGATRVRTAALPLFRLIRRLRPQIILSGMFHLNFLVLLLRPLFPRPVQVFVRQNGTVSASLSFGDLPAYTRLLYRLLYRRADRILCQSNAMATDLILHTGVLPKRVSVLPNPVDVEQIRSSVRQGNSLFAGPGPHLLAVGRLSTEKGFDLLLRAFATLRLHLPTADLVIAGTGPEESPLKKLSRALNLEPAVLFAGYIPDPSDYFPGATAFVLPSRHEGLPNALLEAASAGLPIIALPASGGLTDLLADQPGAWLAPEICAESLAATLLIALQQLSPNQRFDHHFMAPFQLQRAVGAYEELIDAVLPTPLPNANSTPLPLKHIALVIPSLDRIAGAEQQTILLAAGLQQRGWRVSVVALSGQAGPAADSLTAQGVQFLTLGMRKGLVDPRGWIRFHRWIKHEKPDIVHAHLPHAAWFARWSRLASPLRVQLDTLHSSSTGSLGRHLGYRLSNWLPDRVTAVSQAVADSHRAARMVLQRTLVVLPNGVEVHTHQIDAASRSALRREAGLEDVFLWFAAGRLESVKDYPTLLSAMHRLPESAHLVIAGAGPLEAELRRMAQQLGVDHRIRFLGFEPNVRRWMHAADGFVLSSRWEGLPMALLEAAACALPSVATDVPGTREVIVANQTGLLAAAGNVPALAQAMTRLMQTPPEQRSAMGNSARQHITQSFSLGSVLDRWESLYNSLLAANPEPSRWPRRQPRAPNAHWQL